MVKAFGIVVLSALLGGYGGPLPEPADPPPGAAADDGRMLCVRHDEAAGTLSVYRCGDEEPILVQHAREGVRPYLHPIVAPDGRGVLTQYRPDHHPHQTGLYWGLKRVNGRDYFMQWEDDHWRRVSAAVVEDRGREVRWRTVYDLLDEDGDATLTETQTWTMQEREGEYLLDLTWSGEAKTDVTVGEFYVGGLFLRMPWSPGDRGEVVNAGGQRGSDAEAQRSIWLDLGVQVEGRDDLAHVAMLDHPDNAAFPTPWRVDGELGVGPSRQILGDWALQPGETEVMRYRLIVYTGDLDPEGMTRSWTDYAVQE